MLCTPQSHEHVKFALVSKAMGTLFQPVPAVPPPPPPSLLRQIGPFLMIGGVAVGGVWLLSSVLSPSRLIGGAANTAGSIVQGATDVVGTTVGAVADTIPEVVGEVAGVIPQTIGAVTDAGVQTITTLIQAPFAAIGNILGGGLGASTFDPRRT